MRRLIALTLAAAVATTQVVAAPGVTTTDVNFRAGPGTTYQSFGVLPEGTSVEIGDCNDSGSWCAVKANGQDGFVSGQYLEETEDPTGWPRAFDLQDGAQLVMYQPQFTDWSADFRTLSADVATEYVKGDANPAFGVISVVASSEVDKANDEVVLTDIRVTDLQFSTLGRDQLSSLAVGVGQLLPTGPVTVAEQRVTASLADMARMTDVEGLKADPPPIYHSTVPAILVQTDGEAAYAPVKGDTGLSFVINTNWDLFRVDADGTHILRDETHWLTAPALDGNWTATTDLPDLVTNLPDDGNWEDARAALPPTAFDEGAAPKVVLSNVPAELIVFDGDPKLEAVPGTSLEWAANTESDVFFDTANKTWYFLTSGRWFRATSLDGPWTFATPDLPADFQNLPEDAPYYSVRSSVPGTSESAEARLKASIPSTARVEEGAIEGTATYEGDPTFEAIEGTELSYATNTESDVIKVGDSYYLLQDGVWFVSSSPNGPWALAKAVPDAIYEIPPSSPVYNTTYVRVYEVEDNAVWYGYTAGYLWGVLAWGTFVYGTGWRYPPNWVRYPNRPPIYWARPVTYGVGAYYNPVRGTYGRYGYAYGPYRGIAGGARWNPRTGTYVRGGAVWGPAGGAGFIAAYNPRTGTGGFVRGGHNIYGSWGSAGVRRGSEWARVSGGTNRAGGAGVRWGTSAGNQGFVRSGRRGNVYAGRDGSVYRNTGDGWQKWDGGWNGVDRPARGDLVSPRDGGLQNLDRGARDRLAGNALGRGADGGALAGIAAGGAAGAVGGALANRPAGQRPNAGNRPAQRPAAGQRPAQRPAAGQRPAQRPAASQRPQTRPARQAPSHLSRDVRTRQAGNQRRVSSRQQVRRGNVRSAPARAAPRRGGGGHRGGRGGRRR